MTNTNYLSLSYYICQKKFANLVLHTGFFEFSANYPTYVRMSQIFIPSIQPKKDTSFRQRPIYSPCVLIFRVPAFPEELKHPPARNAYRCIRKEFDLHL